MDEDLKKTAQEVISNISKRSYLNQYGDVFVVEVSEELDKLLYKLDELSK